MESQTDLDRRREEQEELEAERVLKARVHRHMGMTAAVLAVGAVIVALARMKTMFGISAWEALGIGSSTLPWLLGILVAAVVLSMGTTRLMTGVERVVRKLTGKKAGR